MSTYYSPKVVTDGLVCYLDAGNSKCYPLTGATITDLSSTVGTFSGNASYINSSTGLVSGASWSCASTSILDTDTHSIFFRIRFNSNATYPNGTTGGFDKIFSYNAGGGDRSPSIWKYPNNRWLHWRYNPNNSGTNFGPQSTSLITSNEFVLGTWYYVGVTKNGASTRVYVDGNSIGTGTASNPKTAGSAPVIIFESTSGLTNLDNLFIYNRVLSDSEVLQNHSALKTRIGTAL